MKKFRLLTLIVLILSFSLLFVACNNDDKNTEAPSSTPTEAPTQGNTEHTHVFSDATCTAPKTCECGATQGSPKGHTYTDTVTAPTCTQAGFTTHTCECGDTYTDTPVDALGHNFENGACEACGETDPDYIPPHTHSYTSVVTNPTCTTGGYTTHTCECGETYTDHAIDALGHDFEDGVCGVCGEADPNYVPPHTHNHTSVVTPPTCTKDGYTTHTCSCGDSYTDTPTEALGHDFEDGVCGVCGEADPNYVPPHTHNHVSVVTPPTCTKDGYTTHTCSCGDSYTDTPVGALGHDYDKGACKVCGAEDPDYDAGGDNPVVGEEFTVSKSHTDIEAIAGVTAGQNAGNIADMSIALDNYISIVCAKGSSTSDPCIYDESIRLYQNGATITVKAANGAEIKTIVITLATKSGGQGPISVNGGQASSLADNKYTITVNEGVSEVVITTTGTDKNNRLYIANISVTYTAESTGGNGGNSDSGETSHQHSYTSVVTPPTCIKDGYTTHTCGCGDSYTDTPVSSLGHDYVSGACSVCGTADPDYTQGGGSEAGYVRVTKAEDFTSGTYIIVTSTGVGLGAYDNGWVTVSSPTINNEVATDGTTWTLTVNGSSVTLTDANGITIKPKSGNNNGIANGSYDWAWEMNANGLVTFKGTGSDTTTLASNTGSDGKFRAYKNTTVSGNPNGYPSEFVVYKLVG